MPGLKHLIECHCILPLYKSRQKIIFHKFPVYSKIEDGKLISKLVKCNNCDAVHLVNEVCRSEIQPGKDQTTVTVDIDDMSLMVSEKLSKVLKKNSADLATWEHTVDIIEEERWGENVILSREIIEEKEHVKVLTVISEDRFKISTEVISDLIT